MTATLDQQELLALDARHVLHPMSANAPSGRHPLVFVRGDGVWLEDAGGDRYLDGFSGLMNVNLGYGRADVARVAAEQMERLQYSPLFFGYTHPIAVDLGQRLAEIAPGAIEQFHYVNSGSEANETAVKLARQYFSVLGRPEKRGVIARRGGYHGATYGALSWTGLPIYQENVGGALDEVEHVAPTSVDELADAIDRIGADRIAAFIAEPVAMSAGLPLPPPGYWPAVRELLDANDILLVMDEVVTGLGRTGRWLGCAHWDLEPDLLVLAKGLTSGYAAMAAVGVTSRVVDTLRERTALFNSGFTMGGNQVGCAVALESIRIVEREGLLDRATWIGDTIRGRIADDMTELGVSGVRNIGLLVAFELEPAAGAEPGDAGRALVAAAIEERLLARAYGDTLVVGPPLVANAADADALTTRLRTALERVRAG
jgi:putrescine---pyruvate transaminase